MLCFCGRKRKWLPSAVVIKNKSRTFNEKLENKYFFINVNNKCVCLIYNASVPASKKCNVE
jgi:hypothetical protein